MKPDLRSFTAVELVSYLQEMGQPAYRGRQLFRQAQALAAPDFAAMSDLPRSLREQLAAQARLSQPRICARHLSAARDTAKLLLEFEDGERVEMALMLYAREQSRDRATCCVSSQSGCAMGCAFCATGMFRQFRNLSAGEIVAQVQAGDALARELGFSGVTNVVYMGMGEPLANPQQVLRSIELLNDAQGMRIGARRITVSTCGLVPQIRKMADWGLQVGLAVSLHSADAEKRRRLMPGAAHWKLDELLAAMLYYQERTGRRVTCEYALIAGINDSLSDARKLVRFLTGSRILVNIIPANALPERGIHAPAAAQCAAFCRAVREAGIELAVRELRGADIEAACGQLRKRCGTDRKAKAETGEKTAAADTPEKARQREENKAECE